MAWRINSSWVNNMFNSQPHWARTSAIAGAVVWTVLLPLRTSPSHETELINRILLLGAVVIVPLGLALVTTPDRNGHHSLLYRLAIVAQPVGAMAVVVSFFLESGAMAAALASLWFVVTSLIALFGLWRLLPRGLRPAEEASIDGGLIYLPIGGVWLIMSRLGAEPLGFGDTIVLLTAVHFHFAGFAAPVLAGLAGRAISRIGPLGRLFKLAIVLVIGGTPLVAAGITLSPPLALSGAVVISTGLIILAVVILIRLLPAVDSWTARSLLAISALSSLVAMVLACVYAYSIVVKELIIDIPRMAMTHGLVNSLGFALCGLIAWSILKPASCAALPGVPFSKLFSRGFVGPDYFRRVGAISSTKPPALGLVDSFSAYRRADFNPDAIHQAVRSFYEQTFSYELIVRPHWRRGFRLGGRLENWLGTIVGQMRLPVAAERVEDLIASRLAQLDDAVDGRAGVRAWVRTYHGTERAMYVAAYATHFMAGNVYMNIAFPMPGGNVSSILHIAAVAGPSGAPDSIALSTLPSAFAGGDQGVYFANRLLPVRLPINEVITVWPATKKTRAGDRSDGKQPTVKARHDMWIWGIKFLHLEYDIFPIQSPDRKGGP